MHSTVSTVYDCVETPSTSVHSHAGSTVRGAAVAQAKLVGGLYVATLLVLRRSSPKFLRVEPPFGAPAAAAPSAAGAPRSVAWTAGAEASSPARVASLVRYEERRFIVAFRHGVIGVPSTRALLCARVCAEADRKLRARPCRRGRGPRRGRHPGHGGDSACCQGEAELEGRVSAGSEKDRESEPCPRPPLGVPGVLRGRAG